MSLPAIRAALAAIIAATPAVIVQGQSLSLAACYPYEPEVLEIMPVAILGDATGTIEQGSLEVWTHDVPLTVLLNENQYGEMERQAIELFLLAVVAQIRSHFTANGTAAGVLSTNYTQGQLTYKGKPYRGFTLTLSIEDKFEVAGLIAA